MLRDSFDKIIRKLVRINFRRVEWIFVPILCLENFAMAMLDVDFPRQIRR